MESRERVCEDICLEKHEFNQFFDLFSFLPLEGSYAMASILSKCRTVSFSLESGHNNDIMFDQILSGSIYLII